MFLTEKNHRLSNLVGDVEQQWLKLVDNFFKPNNLGELKNKLKTNSGYPKLDSFTIKDGYVIQASVSGVKPEDLSVELFTDNEVNYLRISGQMCQEYTDENAMFSTKELRRGSFTRTIALPDFVEGDPEAKIKDGLVTLTWKTKKLTPKEEVKKITLRSE